MSHSSSDKYKEFRNFMVNELGITKEDIKAWTQEAVSREVIKLIGQFNLEQMAEKACREKIFNQEGDFTFKAKQYIEAELGRVIGKRLQVSIDKSQSYSSSEDPFT